MKPVWIVDDDRSIRWVIEKALIREGIAFSSFSSAQEALDALSGSTPEVLVSDVRMPGLSGLELLQTVKQRHPAVPVIVPHKRQDFIFTCLQQWSCYSRGYSPT